MLSDPASRGTSIAEEAAVLAVDRGVSAFADEAAAVDSSLGLSLRGAVGCCPCISECDATVAQLLSAVCCLSWLERGVSRKKCRVVALISRRK